MQAYLRAHRTRRNVVCSAECRQKVIKSVIVGQIDCGQLNADFVSVTVKQVVVSDGNIEKIPGDDTGWILIVVLRFGCGNVDEG